MFRFVLTLCFLLAAVRPSAALTETEIQRFIDDAVKAGGGEVVLPPGVHVIEKGLRLKDAKKLRLIGLDAEECVLKGGKDAPALLLISGECSELRLEKLTFEGGREAIAAGGSVTSGSKMLIGRCFFQNQQGAAILLDVPKVEGLEIDGCTFRDIGAAGVVFGGQVSGSQITHNHFTRCQMAVRLAGSQKCLVASNELSSCETGVLVEGGNDRRPADQGNIIALNAIERSAKNGIELGRNTRSNSVIQNQIASSGAAGVRIFGDGHAVKGNQISGSGAKNIAVGEGEHQLAE